MRKQNEKQIVEIFALATFLFFFLVLGQEFLQSNSCPESYGEQVYAHPEACDQFVLCLNGTLSVEQCENGLLYDGKGDVHNHCNYYHEVDCGSRKADSEYNIHQMF